MVTDKLCGYAAALRELMPSVKHLSRKGLNNGQRTATGRCGNERNP